MMQATGTNPNGRLELCRRVSLDSAPVFHSLVEQRPAWQAVGDWPCRWIAPAGESAGPWVAVLRCVFDLDTPLRTRIHVTADERYELFIDGKRVGRGPERGVRESWYYESYDLVLSAGKHVIAARLLRAERYKPWSQVSVRPGFLLCAEDERARRAFGTGVASWQAKLLPGYRLYDVSSELGTSFGGGPGFEIDAGTFAWNFEELPDAAQPSWPDAVTLREGVSGFWLYALQPVHWLQPGTLPAMLDQPIEGMTLRYVGRMAGDESPHAPIEMAHDDATLRAGAGALLEGRPWTLPATTRVRVLLDLNDYACFYPSIQISGGGSGTVVEVAAAESLYQVDELGARHKGDRNDIDGKCLFGVRDRLISDGGVSRRLEPLWWRCGRYLELRIVVGDQPAVVDGFELRETRYPLDTSVVEGWACGDDQELTTLLRRCVRTLEVSAYETYTDCPYYEQLMYIGDTRLGALLTYVTSNETRLPRKALRMFDLSSANPTRLPTSNAPSASGQVIPPFALWWVCMIHDYARWRGDAPFVRTLLPGARGVIDQFLANADEITGLIRSLPGWNYVDMAWPDGTPPGGKTGQISGIVNWQCVLALRALAELEHWIGVQLLAQRYNIAADRLIDALQAHCWHAERELFADDPTQTHFSEHAQVLAILSGALSNQANSRLVHAMASASDLAKTNLYFTHYWFEAVAKVGREDLWFDRLRQWYELMRCGYVTTPEINSGDARSDCHPWSAYPAYHFASTVGGIRPGAMGFEQVEIHPMMGALKSVSVAVPHPSGKNIVVHWKRSKDELQGWIALPSGVQGNVRYKTKTIPLSGGEQYVVFDVPEDMPLADQQRK